MSKPSFDEAVQMLRKIVNNSNVENQPFVDLNLCSAQDRAKHEEALMVTREAVIKGEITEDELKSRLGLI